MEKTRWKTYAFWLLVTEAVGALSGFLTREGSELYRTTVTKPPLSPPGVVFPIVWGILFALMAIGAARVDLSAPSEERTAALGLYWVQLAVNFFWSILFFNLRAWFLSLLWLILLWVLVLRLRRAFGRVDALAGKLQLPYLLWVSFAAYLNAGVWLLNR
jgi:tryptophan-rich sensory protein